MVTLTDFIEKVIKCWQHQTSTPFPTAKLSPYSEEMYLEMHAGWSVREIGCTGILQGALFGVLSSDFALR